MTISPLIPHSLRAGLAAAFLGLNGLAWAVQPADSAASSPSSASLWPPIAEMIGDAPCDSQSQCHTVGIGAKPCGGPAGFLAWSDKKTDPTELLAAVQAHAQAQMQEHKASGLASDCAMLPVPAAVCRPRASDGRKTCELGQGGTNSPI